MSRIVRCSIIQASNAVPATEPLAVQKQAMIEKHMGLIRRAADDGAQIVCLQEIFNGPYFCAEQSPKWYDATESVPSGPTVSRMQSLARELGLAMIVPIYEVEQEGIFYNTAAVLANDGTYLGKYRKTHIPHVAPGFWEKFYFRPGNLGYPVFDLGFAKIGANTFGSWNNRRMRQPMATSLPQSTAWGQSRPGTSANSMAPVTSPIRGVRSSPRLRGIAMKC